MQLSKSSQGLAAPGQFRPRPLRPGRALHGEQSYPPITRFELYSNVPDIGVVPVLLSRACAHRPGVPALSGLRAVLAVEVVQASEVQIRGRRSLHVHGNPRDTTECYAGSEQFFSISTVFRTRE